MLRGIHFRIGLQDRSVAADEVADPPRARRARAVASAIGEAHFALGVAQQWKVEVEFLSESTILSRRVEADAEDLSILIRVFLDVVAEPATFFGSSRCVGLGIEPQNDVLASKIRQAHRVAFMVPHFELRGSLTNLEHRELSSSGIVSQPVI